MELLRQFSDYLVGKPCKDYGLTIDLKTVFNI